MLSTTLLDKAFETYTKTKENQQLSRSPGILFLNEVRHANADIILGIIRDLNGNTYFLRDFEILHAEIREQEFSRIAVEPIKSSKGLLTFESFGLKSVIRVVQY